MDIKFIDIYKENTHASYEFEGNRITVLRCVDGGIWIFYADLMGVKKDSDIGKHFSIHRKSAVDLHDRIGNGSVAYYDLDDLDGYRKGAIIVRIDALIDTLAKGNLPCSEGKETLVQLLCGIQRNAECRIPQNAYALGALNFSQLEYNVRQSKIDNAAIRKAAPGSTGYSSVPDAVLTELIGTVEKMKEQVDNLDIMNAGAKVQISSIGNNQHEILKDMSVANNIIANLEREVERLSGKVERNAKLAMASERRLDQYAHKGAWKRLFGGV